MKETVLDMSLRLSVINGKIDNLTQQLDIATQENIALKNQNSELKQENLFLSRRLAEYQTRKDSHNSSIPPSKDSLGSQAEKSQKLLATRSLREPSGRPSGGQTGHKGSTLEMVSDPDELIEHAPFFCTHCGKDFAGIEGAVVEVRQSVDIPLPVRPIVTEHQVVEKKCSCGHSCQGDFPKHVRSRVSYGSNIRALVTYLSCVQSIPYKRMTEVLTDCFGVTLSQGTVDNILRDMQEKSASVYAKIRSRITQSKVVGADETGENINGELHWMWVWQTPELSYIYSDKSRGKIAIDKHFKNGLSHSILVSDRHASYFNMKVSGHQLCLAHILRELAYLTELDTTQRWSSQLAQLIKETIHKRKTVRWEDIDRESVLEQFKNLLLASTDNLHQKIVAIQKSLTKYKDYVFKFLFEPDVPYENNASERAIRNLKVKQKVSGMFKSNLGSDTYCQIHSITQTAKKNHQNPFSAILAVANNF